MSQQQDVWRGRVSFGAQEEYRVLVGGDEISREVWAEPAGALRAFGELPAVGDWVRLRMAGDFGLIEEVEPRRTAFVRKAAGRGTEAQCIAANVDVVFIVCGLDGEFHPRRIERYLVLAWESGAEPVVVLNKMDTRADWAAVVESIREVAGGAALVAMSALDSVKPLEPWLRAGVTAVLLGSSGVGKSTIANALGAREFATRSVRESDSKGRHTTTAPMLISIAGGAWLIDTPGMRELGLLAGEEALGAGFSEISALARQCRFHDCQHGDEPDCAVRVAVETGEIDRDRWASFQKLQREARHNAREADGHAQRAEKQRWKVIHKAQKQLYRDRGR